ncbi:MAG: GNAT family N-acetyltransferase [Lachnospiraceae bacterium]|nr:GNAT family N-acetyltransferase [Candidatus Equihabitans merdae]
MDIALRPLDKEETAQVYNEHLVYDFPKEEVKGLHSIHRMMDEGTYEVWGVELCEERDLLSEKSLLMDGEDSMVDSSMVGYALIFCQRGQPFVLLDYLAVFKDRRGSGIGGAILSELRRHYAGRCILIESEYPPHAIDEAQAAHRLGFYERNGCLRQDFRVELFMVDYCIYALSDKNWTREEALAGYDAIYKMMIRDDVRRQEVLHYIL